MGSPKQGEIWIADLKPVRGQEIDKSRPVLIVSGDGYRSLTVRVVVPITGMTSAKSGRAWLVPLAPSQSNGLFKDSVADALQVRSLSVSRFSKRVGRVSPNDLREVVTAIALVVEPG